MTSPDVTRRLAAIFSADVAGYSRLMQANEVETVHRLQEYKEVLASLIQ